MIVPSSLDDLKRLAQARRCCAAKILDLYKMAFTPRFIQRKLTNAGFSQVRAVARDFLLPNTPPRLISSMIKIGDFLEKDTKILPGPGFVTKSALTYEARYC
jgi:hypothetical protein